MGTSSHKGAALLLAAALVGCGARHVPLRDPGSVLLASPQQDADVRAAIARALRGRNFTTENEQPGRIIARFDQRAMSFRVAIEYSGTQYAIHYVDSQGMGYQVGPEGPMIDRRFVSHVGNLRRSIDDELGRPAREAQAAVEAQREHELALAESQRQQAEEARQAAADERERDRQAALEAERLRTARAQAEAEARRPIIVGHSGAVVTGMAFNPRTARGARFGAIRLSQGFHPDPRTMNGAAVGNTSAPQLAMPQGCTGFYQGQPEHLVVLGTHMPYFRVEAHAQADTTLAVVAPDGSVWCDDDGAGGVNPRIAGEFPAGSYRVFVGTYQQGVTTPYSLELSELEAQGGPQPVAQPAQPAAAPDCRSALLAAGHAPVHMIHCNSAEPRCAVALLQAGHNPAHLVHCQGVDPGCAEGVLRAGRNPAELVHCR